MLLRDLHWLIALADAGHVTGTAERLGITQPTLSRALSRIETELGARLFERLPAGVALTPAGAVVVAAARDIVGRYDQLRSDVGNLLDPDAGVVRLAYLDSIATSLVPQLLRAFHEDAPRVKVLLSQEPAHDIHRDLETGAADLAIATEMPSGSYAWHPVQEERLVLAVPARHRLATRTHLRLEELGDEEFVTTPAGFGHRHLSDSLLRAAGVTPTISFESQDLTTIEGLVAAGLGVALVPQHLAGHSGTVGVQIDADGARRTIGLSWRGDRPLAGPAARLREFVTTRFHARSWADPQA